MKTIDTLIEDVYTLLTKGFHTYEHFLYDTGRYRSFPHPSDDTPRLRFSNMGTPCTRQLWYKINQPELGEEFTGATLLKFQYGHLLEDYLLWLAENSGHEVSYRQYELEVEGIKGHIDAVIDGCLVDVKTASGFAFNKFENNTLDQDDPFGYRVQLALYHYALSRDDPMISDTAYFWAVNKDNGKMCLTPFKPVYPLDEHGSVDWQQEDTFGWPLTISYTKYQLEQQEPPERGFDPVPDGKSGNKKLGVNCSYCAFKHTCWPGLRTFLYSNGPRFLTTVVKEPNVFEN